jgi:hypothetical protein
MNRITRNGGALALLIALTSIACGGGGGGGGGSGGGGPTTPPGVNFTTNGAISGNSIYLTQGGGTNASRLVIEVRASSVQALYGAAYDIVFPTSMLSFTKATEGGFQKGSTSFQAAIGSPGRLIVGQTNLGSDEPESGSGLLATIEFAVIGNGSGSVSFDNEQAFRNGSVPQDVNFISGNLTVSN